MPVCQSFNFYLSARTCCEVILVQSRGEAGDTYRERMGVYTAHSELTGRTVFQHVDRSPASLCVILHFHSNDGPVLVGLCDVMAKDIKSEVRRS